MNQTKEAKKKRNYDRDIARTLRGCATDAVLWGVFALAFLLIAAGLYTGKLAPERILPYSRSVIMMCLTGGLIAAAKCIQSLTELAAAKTVVKRAAYTVMLTQEQQNRIFRSVCAQSFLGHLIYFLIGALPVSAALYYLYHKTGDNSPLIAMAIVDGILLFMMLLSFGLDAGRLASVDGFCTISDRGIITANEILPFSAAEGDVKSLENRGEDYLLRFQRICFLGIRRNYRFPLPKNGTLGGKAAERPELTEEEALKEVLLNRSARETEHLAALSQTETQEAPGSPEASVTPETPEMSETPEMPGSPETKEISETREAAEAEDVQTVRQNRWIRKAAAVMALVLLVVFGAALLRRPTQTDDPAMPVQTGTTDGQPGTVKEPEQEGSFVDEVTKSDLMQDEMGVWYSVIGGEKVVLVNKEHPVPRTYGGIDETASNALEEMFKAAEKEGVSIYLVSGYRSYDLQSSLYDKKVAQVGEGNAEFQESPPGTSEHQTGLAFDVNETDNVDALLNTEFENTEAFEWLNANCAKYGFILRYPKGKRDITGFNYKPWHYRYVGKTAAAAITSEGITLEEYLGAD